MGPPPFVYIFGFSQTDSVGREDADVLISLRPGHHPTTGYNRAIRRMIAERFPDVRVYFQAADIVSQVLNFGLSAPIDAQISGPNLDLDYQIARRLEPAMRVIPGLTDVHVAQLLAYPPLQMAV